MPIVIPAKAGFDGSVLINPFKADTGRGSRVFRAAGGGLLMAEGSLTVAAATTALATGRSPARLMVPTSMFPLSSML